ncbi:chitobiosyldiphosphodolichol beta-mannosyltransferase-like [Babylonia areolata]|uniref:chitobiosyldiphosphodolichol beta-mannosyltransferase-like n=1 Tax=Babylonia areolata TaxID=304850 RepID=UPI003FD10E61
MLYSVQIALLTPFMFVVLYILVNYFVKGEKSVCIVVLGDIGRSPRMQYHALSLSRSGFYVNIVGYGGSIPHKQIRENESIEINAISEAPQFFKYFPGPLGYIFRALWLFLTVFFTLMLLPKSRFYFLQNPPTIPTFPVVWLVCLLRGSQMIIDWHNYGFTILALKLGAHNPLVSISHRVEKVFGRQAVANICVTNAMKEDLAHNWNIRATTVYDRPPDIFKTTPLSEQHQLFCRLAQQYPVFSASSGADDSTLFTHRDGKGDVTKLKDRPVLLVSSTSWTEDEDFGLLLDALENYETNAADSSSKILCVITGKGPQKEMYQEKINRLQWQKVQFCLPWLTAEDYPLLLGSADVGVCLHKSSSGLDLPMKVVDMFGCGLPVCAVRYDCIEELVKPGINGLLFDDSQQLAQQLQELVGEFPDKTSKLKTFRENLKKFQAVRWQEQWTEKVLPLFCGVESCSQ